MEHTQIMQGEKCVDVFKVCGTSRKGSNERERERGIELQRA